MELITWVKSVKWHAKWLCLFKMNTKSYIKLKYPKNILACNLYWKQWPYHMEFIMLVVLKKMAPQADETYNMRLINWVEYVKWNSRYVKWTEQHDQDKLSQEHSHISPILKEITLSHWIHYANHFKKKSCHKKMRCRTWGSCIGSNV